jgi:hypothetical protein
MDLIGRGRARLWAVRRGTELYGPFQPIMKRVLYAHVRMQGPFIVLVKCHVCRTQKVRYQNMLCTTVEEIRGSVVIWKINYV